MRMKKIVPINTKQILGSDESVLKLIMDSSIECLEEIDNADK